jgi:hypothetical protein
MQFFSWIWLNPPLIWFTIFPFNLGNTFMTWIGTAVNEGTSLMNIMYRYWCCSLLVGKAMIKQLEKTKVYDGMRFWEIPYNLNSPTLRGK